jgi:hypothetical protein
LFRRFGKCGRYYCRFKTGVGVNLVCPERAKSKACGEAVGEVRM